MGTSNRYTRLNWNQPISLYTPRPFESLYAVGQNMAKQHAESDSKLGSLQKAFDDIGPLATNVLSEGSTNDPGIRSRETGYEEYKNNIINNIRSEHDQLANDYSTGKLSNIDFDKRVRDVNQKYAGEYNKLKMASANTKLINQMNEEISKNPDIEKRQHLLNEVAKAGTELLSNPFNVSYRLSSIGKAVDKAKLAGDEAKGFEESMLKEGYGYKNPNTGQIEYRSSKGVTIGRVSDWVDQTWDSNEYSGDAKQQVIRKLNDRGLNWNTKLDKPITYKDYKGKEHSLETWGDYLYTNEKESYKQAVIDKAVHEVSDLKVTQDWMAKLGKEFDMYNPEVKSTSAQSNVSIQQNELFKSYISTDGQGKQGFDVNKLLTDLTLTDDVHVKRTGTMLATFYDLISPNDPIGKRATVENILDTKIDSRVRQRNASNLLDKLMNVSKNNQSLISLNNDGKVDINSTLLNTANYLQDLNTVSFRDNVPDTDVATAITKKFITNGQLDLNKAKVLDGGETNTLATILEETNKDLNENQKVKPQFVKIDYNSDKDGGGKAAFIWKIGDKEVSTKIDNKDYQKHFDPVAKLYQQSYNTLTDDKNKISGEQKVMATSAIKYVNKEFKTSGLSEIDPDLIVASTVDGQDLVINYKDNQDPALIKTISITLAKDKKGNTVVNSIQPYDSFITYMNDKTDQLPKKQFGADIRRHIIKTPKNDYTPNTN